MGAKVPLLPASSASSSSPLVRCWRLDQRMAVSKLLGWEPSDSNYQLAFTEDVLLHVLACLTVQLHLTLCDPVDCSLLCPSRQEYWSGLPRPCPGDLSNPGPGPGSPALAGGFFTG